MNSETENPTESPVPVESPASNLFLKLGAAAESTLTADLALAIVKDRSLSSEVIEQLNRNTAVMKSRKVRVALAAHPRTSRRIALGLIRDLYTFDLMQFSLIPTVAADLKRVADEILVARLASITLGERIALARRSSAMVAAALLLDAESRVWQTALQNPRVSEASVVKALLRPNATPAFVKAVCHHAKMVSSSRSSLCAFAERIHSVGPRSGIRPPPSTRTTARHPAFVATAEPNQELFTR